MPRVVRDVLAVCGGGSAIGREEEKVLRGEGLSVQVANDAAGFQKLLASTDPRVAIVELFGDVVQRLALIRLARGCSCIVVAHHGSEDLAVACLRAGAADYLRAPVILQELLDAVRALSPDRASPDDTIIGDDGTTRGMLRYLDRVSATSTTVLITGETGTGKELAARHIHSHSPRRHKAFISVNCAAVPDTLLESELFGYERGAFTGAHAQADGKWKTADGGTLLLDEIGDMSPAAQAKILRVLESREVWRLGGSTGTPVDVRVVAATNQDIEKLVAEGKFRADLYYRLNVARVHLPPLRERRSDISLLVSYYVRQMNTKFQRSILGFTPETMKQLEKYHWPGNVRELKNLVEAAFVDLPEGRVEFAELPEALRARFIAALDAPPQERDELLSALRETRWNVSKAAARLQMSRMTIYRKIAKYGIERAAAQKA